MSSIVIRNDDDLENHFKEHDKRYDELSIQKIDCDDVLSNEYKRISKECDKFDISYGDFGIFGNKIEMYYLHEGAVLSNIQYCPFCGIKFVLEGTL